VTLPCFVCARELESACGGISNPPENQPYAGTTFRSPGQYGSTAWDPQTHGVELELNVCDPCLLAGHGRVLRIVVHHKPVRHSEPWTPGSDEE
jgi:hypothetical protein